MEVLVTHETVVPRRMMLGEIVGHVGRTLAPDETELFLIDAIVDPIKTHIKGFRKFLSHRSVQDARGSRIIIENWGAIRRLWMPKLSEGNTHRTSTL